MDRCPKLIWGTVCFFEGGCPSEKQFTSDCGQLGKMCNDKPNNKIDHGLAFCTQKDI